MSKQVATFDLNPKSLDEAMRYADIIATTNICPKQMQGKPGDVLVAIQYGLEMGMKPLQAIQNIAVINGRPTVWGDALLAVVKASGELEFIDEQVTAEQATCTLKRRGEAEVVRTFSMAQAKKAGLAGKQGPWSQYPERMMQMRARSFALRDVFPDILAGLIVREEAADMTPIERDVTPEQPKIEHKAGDSLKDKVAAAVGQEPESIDADQLGAFEQVRERMVTCESMDQLSEIANEVTQHVDDPRLLKELKEVYRGCAKALTEEEEPC